MPEAATPSHSTVGQGARSRRAKELVLVGGGHAHVQVLRAFLMNPPADNHQRVQLTVVLDRPTSIYSGMVPGLVAGQYRAEELEIDIVPLARRAGARIVLSAATRLRPKERLIELEGRTALPYDVASFDIGSTVAGLDLPGIRQYALPTRPIARLVERANEVALQYERFCREPAPELTKPAATDQAAESREPFRVLVVGGGAGGVELAFAFQERLSQVTSTQTASTQIASKETGAGCSPFEIHLLHAGDRLLPGYDRSLAERVTKAAERRGIQVRLSQRVERIDPFVETAGAEAVLPGSVSIHPLRKLKVTTRSSSAEQPSSAQKPTQPGSGKPARPGADVETSVAHAVVWVTGATSQPLFRQSEVETDDRGFVLVRDTLQLKDHPEVFAVGDCATLENYPETAKAGVYAVRQGPYLLENLDALLKGRPLRAYKPQSDFLTLLNLGDGEAIGAKWGRSFSGRWVMRWKNQIDRKFMRRFQVLKPSGETTREFSGLPGMMMAGMDSATTSSDPESQNDMPAPEMACGGCAAKLAQEPLQRALARVDRSRPDLAKAEGPGRSGEATDLCGLAPQDDAAAFRSPSGDVLVTSVDQFRAFCNDPWLVGRVAAVNALSDLEAKGVRPSHAQALVSIPEKEPEGQAEETLFQTLSGIRSVLDPLAIRLLGGHTTVGRDLQVGLVVEGFSSGSLLPMDGLKAGDWLILTKPLGTGVLLHADMSGRCRGEWLELCLGSMQQSNGPAAQLALRLGAHAATDVTGFGLAGHLVEMVESSSVKTSLAKTSWAEAGALQAELKLNSLPILPGVLELMASGERSTFHPQNERARQALEFNTQDSSKTLEEVLFDPQTAGGLLLALPEAAAREFLALLPSEQPNLDPRLPGAAVIGKVTAPVVTQTGHTPISEPGLSVSEGTGPERTGSEKTGAKKPERSQLKPFRVRVV